MGIYLGIDESNHGRFPEVFAAVRSISHQDIKPNESGLPKKGNRRKKNVYDILRPTQDFRYILFSRDDAEKVGKENMKTVVLAECLKYYEDTELVIFDGTFVDSTLEDLARILHPQRIPEIRGEAKGDTKYPLVNLADTAAHSLFRYYERFKFNPNQARKYIKHKLDPEIELYALALKRLDKSLRATA